jgi:hypothetical protein
MSQLDALIAALAGVPALPGARCAGRWDAWDNEHGNPELTEYAINQCGACPVLADCRSWLDSLKPSKRPIGIVAARVVRQHRKAAA